MWHQSARPNRIATDFMENRIRPLNCRGGPDNRRPGTALALGLGLALLLAGNTVSATTQSGEQAHAGVVDFKNQSASPDVRHVALWVLDSDDNRNMPYMIVDKVNARVFAFDAHGNLLGADTALLGLARGDRSVEGIGDRKMSAIRPEERTTPAGRFKASLDHDVHGQEILVIDYADSISLHPVVKGTPAEHRAQRMASASSLDKRISYGCINVPLKFYKTIVSPNFAHTYGIVYILPEMSPVSEFFGFQDVDTQTQARDSPQIAHDAPQDGNATTSN